MLVYRSAIFDECGSFVAWCDEVDEQAVLNEHPEWFVKCIEFY